MPKKDIPPGLKKKIIIEEEDMGVGENTGENIGENTGTNGHISSGLAAPNYTPILMDDMSAHTVDETYPPWQGSWDTRKMVRTDRAYSGTKSLKLTTIDGTNYYGGDTNLSTTATIGEQIWYRAYFYMPASFSLSHKDQPDGWDWGKFLMLCIANHVAPRVYLQLASPQQEDYESGTNSNFYPLGISIAPDGDITFCGNVEPTWELPRDQWFSLQISCKIETSGGWLRAWADGVYMGGCVASFPAGYTIGSWGLGNYWNGLFWVKNDSTLDFWMDEIIITKEEPNTTDSGGRPFIHPDHLVSDF